MNGGQDGLSSIEWGKEKKKKKKKELVVRKLNGF